jgi:hypothetical protein
VRWALPRADLQSTFEKKESDTAGAGNTEFGERKAVEHRPARLP